jgi:hypothetical protein
MVNSLFKLSITLAVFTIWAGIMTAAFAGGQKPIELGWVPRVWVWISTSGKQSTQPEPNPSPFIDEAKKSASELAKLAKTPTPQPQPDSAPKTSDLRLSGCPEGSYDALAAEVSLEQAKIFQQKLSEGLKPKTLLTVQSYLGQPNCVIQGKTYVYLVTSNRVIRASLTKTGQPLKIEFTGF